MTLTPLMTSIGEVCGEDPELKSQLQGTWLRALDRLRSLLARQASENRFESNSLQPDYESGLLVWNDLGSRIFGCEDDSRALEAIQLRQLRDSADLIGCSWWRCPLNGGDDLVYGREPLRCSECRIVSCPFLIASTRV